MSRNLRTALIFSGFVSLIGATFYPIYFRPLMLREEYPAVGEPREALDKERSGESRSRVGWHRACHRMKEGALAEAGGGQVARYTAGRGAEEPAGWQASQPPVHLTLSAALLIFCSPAAPALAAAPAALATACWYWRPQDAAHISLCPNTEKEQAINRAGIVQEDVQPPVLSVGPRRSGILMTPPIYACVPTQHNLQRRSGLQSKRGCSATELLLSPWLHLTTCCRKHGSAAEEKP
ncbi:Small integral membrane protein 20 [Galemys pyrenaicus]|uniref:Small integral membrane protein 20 n=1 Tax=Galemys pyrenaicus TaxID=202257 RepID=A0A8J6A1S9_GALPY|nr:Small integral membrane protein 20 [Galemys pyrenaicus]